MEEIEMNSKIFLVLNNFFLTIIKYHSEDKHCLMTHKYDTTKMH